MRYHILSLVLLSSLGACSGSSSGQKSERANNCAPTDANSSGRRLTTLACADHDPTEHHPTKTETALAGLENPMAVSEKEAVDPASPPPPPVAIVTTSEEARASAHLRLLADYGRVETYLDTSTIASNGAMRFYEVITTVDVPGQKGSRSSYLHQVECQPDQIRHRSQRMEGDFVIGDWEYWRRFNPRPAPEVRAMEFACQASPSTRPNLYAVYESFIQLGQ